MTLSSASVSQEAARSVAQESGGQVLWWKTAFGDEELRWIGQAIAQGNISQGPVTAEFERRVAEILGVPYVIATTSGSIALLMALLAVGVGPGDEVIVPNRAWIAAAHAPRLLGATVVLVDVEADRPVMDVNQLECAITPRTKAIIPVHLNGRSVNMKAVRSIAAAHRLSVIEDAAQAFGSKNAEGFLGCQADLGCFSLSVAKLISTGQGGLVVTRDLALYDRLASIRTHGVGDFIDVTYARLGFNFRFTDLQASVGMAQLARLSARIASLTTLYKCYAVAIAELPAVRMIPVDLEGDELPLYVEVLCQEREVLRKFLATRGIQTRPFYPDLHQAVYLDNRQAFPRSAVFGSQGLFLPCGPSQPVEHIDRVLQALRAFRSHA